MFKKIKRFVCAPGVLVPIMVFPFGIAFAEVSTPEEKASQQKELETRQDVPLGNSATAIDASNQSVKSAAVTEDVDEQFSTEGYVGGYLALLQQTVPTLGLTASMYLDDGFRLGVDFSRGSSEMLFSNFVSQGASVWGAWEVLEGAWVKGGLGYSHLEKPTKQEPLSVLLKGEDRAAEMQGDKSDTFGVDLSLGQLWSFKDYSVSVDYLGFFFPILRLTGPKIQPYSIHALRAELLYNLE